MNCLSIVWQKCWLRELGEDTVICIFPGGHGMNTIQQLMKPVDPYNKFIKEIATAYDKAQERGWEFLFLLSAGCKGNRILLNIQIMITKNIFIGCIMI